MDKKGIYSEDVYGRGHSEKKGFKCGAKTWWVGRSDHYSKGAWSGNGSYGRKSWGGDTGKSGARSTGSTTSWGTCGPKGGANTWWAGRSDHYFKGAWSSKGSYKGSRKSQGGYMGYDCLSYLPPVIWSVIIRGSFAVGRLM